MALERACIDVGSTRLMTNDLSNMDTIVAQCMRAILLEKGRMMVGARCNASRVIAVVHDDEHGDDEDRNGVRDQGLTNDVVVDVEEEDSSRSSSSSSDGTREHLFESYRRRAQSIEREVRLIDMMIRCSNSSSG